MEKFQLCPQIPIGWRLGWRLSVKRMKFRSRWEFGWRLRFASRFFWIPIRKSPIWRIYCIEWYGLLISNMFNISQRSQKSKEKVRRDKADRAIAEIPSVLKGYGERMTYRSPSPRLRGEAAIAIGEASKASHGVPWRSLLVQLEVVKITKWRSTLLTYWSPFWDGRVLRKVQKDLVYPTL